MTKEAADTGAIAKKAASPNTTMKRRSADESSTATSTTRGPDAGSPRKSNSPPSCEEVKKEEAGVDENAAPSMLMKPEKRRYEVEGARAFHPGARSQNCSLSGGLG